MGTSQKKKKRTEDTRSITNEVKRAQDQDIIKAVIEPELEVGFGPQGVGTKSYVNASTNIVVGIQTNAGTVDTTPPAQVTGLVVTVVSSSQLNLTWTASAASDLNHYNVYRGTSSGFPVTPGVTVPNATIPEATNSYSDTGLTASTTYYYKVLAADDAGNLGTLSAQGTATTQAVDTTAPAQTVGLTVTATVPGQLNLSWTASAASDLDHYNVYRGDVSGFTVTPGTTFPLTVTTTNSYIDTGLLSSTTYYYKVLAVDTSGNLGTISAQGSATTIAPDAIPPAQVTGLVVSSVTASTIKLNWTANVETDLNHYNVYRGTTAGFVVTPGTTVPIGPTPTTNTFTSGGLTGSTTYYFKVAAVDDSGNIGTLSAEVSGTTTAAGAFTPNLWLKLDNNFTDSANGITMFASNPSGFSTRSAFGSRAMNFRYPVDTNADQLYIASPPSHLDFDTAVGFSVSLWIFPADVTSIGGAGARFVIGRRVDADNGWSIQIDSSNKCYFFVKKDGTDYLREASGFTLNKWHHICAIFNGIFNTLEIYRNGSPGVASVVTPDFNNSAQATRFFIGDGNVTNRFFEGMIDEVQYFKAQVISLTDVLNLMASNSPSDEFPIPVTFYNGTSDYVTTPDAAALDLTTNWTVAAWIRTAKNYTTEGFIVNKGGIGTDTTGENMNYGIYVQTGNIARALFETSAGVDSGVQSSTSVNDGEMHLVVATYNGTNLILYLDNVSVSTATTATPETNAKPLVVAKNSRLDDRYLEGWIGDPQVWNRAWTAPEVSTYFNTYGQPSDITARVYYLTDFKPDIWHQMNLSAVDSGRAGIPIAFNGTAYDPTNKKFGSHALDFNPVGTTDEHIALASGLSYEELDYVTNGFSFSIWIRPTDVSALATERHIMDWVALGSKVLLYISTTGKLGVYALYHPVGAADQSWAKLHQTTLTINTFHHVVITFDPSQIGDAKLKLYLNKVVDSGDTTLSAGTILTAGVQFGNLNGRYFRGQMDEDMFFRNRILNANQISSLFTNNFC